jgi:hypothetical protein
MPRRLSGAGFFILKASFMGKKKPPKKPRKKVNSAPEVDAPPEAPEPEAKPGRPTSFSEDIGDLICALMAEGKSLRSICELENMPHKSTVLLWVVKGDRGDEQYRAFSDQYRRAREAQTEAVLDDVIEISDDNRLDYIFKVADDASGQSAQAIVDHDHINRSKLRIETRFRFAAKMHPRKYGDKVQQEITGKDGGPVELSDAKAALLRGVVRNPAADGADSEN